MRTQELVDYCDVSESGHFKWYPKGVLIRRLLLDYAKNLAQEWGAMEMDNPLLIRGDNNVVGQLMGEFHERDYKVDGGRGIGYLRYASDPLGFPFMQKVKFTYKQAPLKVYEEASCFRNEQEGEVSGLKRVRNFLMTDMHAACSNEKEAREEFEKLCIKFGELMDDIIAEGRWVLGWEGTEEFYSKNKKWLIGIAKKMKVPSFFKLSKEMNHYYAIKNEYQTITEDKSNIQVSTVQWDVKDGPRFDIGYIGKDSKKHPCPVILHASSFGSIERTLCSILENIAIDEKKGIAPRFSYWLSPTQVRIVPVSDKFLNDAEKLANELELNNIRVDIDDRAESVPKKVSESEKEWVPYVIVIGEKEIQENIFALRTKGKKGLDKKNKKDLIKFFKELQGDMPWRSLPLPKLVSKRVKFV
jgi:threonyl-tRNA synthetase